MYPCFLSRDLSQIGEEEQQQQFGVQSYLNLLQPKGKKRLQVTACRLGQIITARWLILFVH